MQITIAGTSDPTELRCKRCRTLYRSNWTRVTRAGPRTEKTFTMVSEGSITCREVVYRRVLEFAEHFTTVTLFQISDLPISVDYNARSTDGRRVYAASAESSRAALTIFNGIMVGLIKAVDGPATFVAESGFTRINIPPQVADKDYGVYGPFLSIALQGFKAMARLTMTDRMIRAERLIAAGNYTDEIRAEILGLVVGAMWIDFGGNVQRIAYFNDLCKETVMYYSLGGLDKMMGKNVNKIGCYTYRGANPRTDHLTQCFHAHQIIFNGSASFYHAYFNRHVDARAVARFIERPHKLTTAKSYIGGTVNRGAPYVQ